MIPPGPWWWYQGQFNFSGMCTLKMFSTWTWWLHTVLRLMLTCWKEEAPMWETLQGQLWVTEPWNSHTVHQATRIRPDSSDYTKVIPPQLLARSEEDLTHLSSFKQLPALMQFSPSLMSPRSKSHPGALPRKGSNGRAPLWASCMDTSLGRMHRTLASTVVYLLLQ